MKHVSYIVTVSQYFWNSFIYSLARVTCETSQVLLAGDQVVFRKIAVCFLWLSLPGHYRVTDEALLAETT